MPFGTETGLAPGHIVLDGDPAPSRPERGTTAPTFRPVSVHSVVAKRSPISVTDERYASAVLGVVILSVRRVLCD